MIRSKKRGATYVEYLVITGCVALAGIATFLAFGGKVGKSAGCIGDKIVGQSGGDCKGGQVAALSGDVGKGGKGGKVGEGNDVAAIRPGDDCPGGVCKSGTGQCFAAGTMVRTASGMRAIESFKQGENVLAGNDETLQTSTFEIEKIVVTEGKEVMELTVESDGTTETLKPTLRHAFWVAGEWVKAMDLKEGDIISTNGSAKARVASVKMTGEITTVYNLEVKDVHTYYVGKTGLFSHNACERVPPTQRLRERATSGELWEKPRFDAINKLAACRDLTEGDYKILADAVKGEKAAKDSYRNAMMSSPSTASTEGGTAVEEALNRPWFDRAEQSIQAASQEGDKGAQAQLSSLRD